MLCSIIIPCYNKKEYISRTLDSIVNNHDIEDCRFECILVDDESTDGTTDILIEYAKKYSYFKYVRILNDGIPKPSNARNFGLTIASGKYVLFIDADDELYSGFLPIAINYLEENTNIDIYVGNFYSRGNHIISYIVSNVNESYLISPFLCSSLIRKSSIQNLKFENVYCEDAIFTNKLIHILKCKYYYNENNPISFIYQTVAQKVSINDIGPLNDINNEWMTNIVYILQNYIEYNYCLDSSLNIIEKINKPIQNIEYNITINQCIVKCKYCKYFTKQFYRSYYLSYHKIKNDILNLSRYSDNFKRLTISGGESFLNPDLLDILTTIRKLLPNNEIVIYTSGFFYKKLYKYINNIIENKIIIQLNVYPNDNQDEIIKTFKELVPIDQLVINYDFINKGINNQLLSKAQTEASDKQILNCDNRINNLQLVDDKLYICNYCAYLNKLKEYFLDENIDITNEDAYIELTENTTIDEILEFIKNKIPMICHYCKNVLGTNYVPFDIQTEKNIEEYIN